MRKIAYVWSRLSVLWFALSIAHVSYGQQESAGAEDGSTPNPLKALRNVVIHGNLADHLNFEQQFGVGLKSRGIGKAYKWGPMCGKIQIQTKAEYFDLSSVPWYFDETHGYFTECGDYPYSKEYVPNGQVRVIASIHVNPEKICILQNQVSENFVGLKYTHGLHNRNWFYQFDGPEEIAVTVLTTGIHNCATVMSLFQHVEWK